MCERGGLRDLVPRRPDRRVPELPDLRLVGRPGRALRGAEGLDLVDRGGVLRVSERHRRRGSELVGAADHERLDPRPVREGGRRERRWRELVVARARARLEREGRSARAVVGAPGKELRRDALPDTDAARLVRARRHPREQRRVLLVDRGAQARVELDQGVVRGGVRGRRDGGALHAVHAGADSAARCGRW